MSRIRKVIHSVGSSYVFLATNVVFSLVSIPLGLMYLSKAEFGIWALVIQITGYLSLIDIGISTSVGRILFDFKDDHGNPRYGEVIKTGTLVLLVQGCLLFILGYGLAPTLAVAMKIPIELQQPFIAVLRWQCAVVAAGFTTRIFLNLLAAHNRFDLANYVNGLQLLSSLVFLWAFLKWDYKLYSWIWANALGWVLCSILMIYCCTREKLFPSPGAWGRVSWERFCELFLLAKDVFLISVGSQFIMASQTLIITRALGLEASAIWAVCTKTFSLFCQLTWRIYDFSCPALAEMIVRQEKEKFAARITDIIMLTASFSMLIGVIFAFTNNPFVLLWTVRTGKAVSWPYTNNILIGIWLVLLAVIRCFMGQGILTKQVGFMRYIYLIEGLVYFGIANAVAPWGGFPAMIITSIICSICFSGAYGTWRMARDLQIQTSEALRKWFSPMLLMAIWLIPLTATIWYFTFRLNAVWHLLEGSILGLVGVYLLLRLGLSRSLQSEILQRASKPLTAVLKHIFPATPQLNNSPAKPQA
jgi:O-antigen/teichoic acid export membrane protein